MPVPMSPTSAFLHKYVKSPIPTPMEVKPYSISKSDDDEPMDTPEQTDGVSLPPPRKICPATKPFESPRQKPIDGVVQPRTEPPPGKPTRHTNCLDFVLNTVLKDAMEHKCSWPFQSPVDTKKLGIPEYHEEIKKPMDLRTIEKRIRNIYYWNAADAILDIKQMFANCYSFNAPQDDVYKMGKTLEKKMMSLLDGIPQIEKVEILPEHQRRTMFSVTDPYGRTKTPKQCGRENTRGRKKGSDLDSHFDDEEGSSAASLQPPSPTLRQNTNSMIDWKSLPPRWQGKEAEWQKCCSKLLKEIHKKEHRGFAHQFYLPVDPIKLNIPDFLDIIKNSMDLQTMRKKLDHKQYTDPTEFVYDMNLMITTCCAYNPIGSVVHQNALHLKALFDELSRQKPINGVVQPRTEPPSGKPTRHTNCLDFVLNTVLKDAMEHEHSWPFQSPVDAKKLGIPEYHEEIKKPMDLRTIEKRIRNIYYWNAADAVDDIKQLFANCYAFNAPQDDVYKMAKTLEERMMNHLDGIPQIETAEILPEQQRRTMFSASLQPPPPILRQNPNSMIDWKSLPPRWQGKEAEWQKFCSNLLKEIHNKENKGFAHVFYLPVDPIKLNIPDYLDIIRNPMDLQTMKKKLDHKQYADPKEFAFDMNLMITNCCVYNHTGSVIHQNALDLKALFDERWKSMPGSGLDPIASKSRREAKSDGNTAPALANNQLNWMEKQGIRIKSSPAKTSNSISPALQSKPRVPVASVASSVPYTPKGDSRESESKSGQSRKKLHTPGSDSPQYVIPKKSRPSNIDPYVSIYGRKNVGVNEKKELSLKMATLQQDFVNPALRIIQIGQFKAGQPVSSLRALCDEEIDFNKATDETILELLDYLQMVEVDKPRAGTVKTEMEVKAMHYGLHLFDDASGMIAHPRIKPTDDRACSDSPAPSAYASEIRSTESLFDDS